MQIHKRWLDQVSQAGLVRCCCGRPMPLKYTRSTWRGVTCGACLRTKRRLSRWRRNLEAKRRKGKTRRAFTLIEVLIRLAIVAIILFWIALIVFVVRYLLSQ